MKLYSIDYEIQKCIEAMFDTVNEETGEVEPGTIVYLSALKEERNKKLDNIGAYIKNEESDVEAIKREIEKLKARQTVKENHIKRLKDYVGESMQAMNEEKFESPRVAFSFRKSEPVVISDESAIPDEYKKTKIEVSPDKTAIKKAIKEGAIIPGASLETKFNLQIK
jgi:seryl-tRNA synthetase